MPDRIFRPHRYAPSAVPPVARSSAYEETLGGFLAPRHKESTTVTRIIQTVRRVLNRVSGHGGERSRGIQDAASLRVLIDDPDKVLADIRSTNKAGGEPRSVSTQDIEVLSVTQLLEALTAATELAPATAAPALLKYRTASAELSDARKKEALAKAAADRDTIMVVSRRVAIELPSILEIIFSERRIKRKAPSPQEMYWRGILLGLQMVNDDLKAYARAWIWAGSGAVPTDLEYCTIEEPEEGGARDSTCVTMIYNRDLPPFTAATLPDYLAASDAYIAEHEAQNRAPDYGAHGTRPLLLFIDTKTGRHEPMTLALLQRALCDVEPFTAERPYPVGNPLLASQYEARWWQEFLRCRIKELWPEEGDAEVPASVATYLRDIEKSLATAEAMPCGSRSSMGSAIGTQLAKIEGAIAELRRLTEVRIIPVAPTPPSPPIEPPPVPSPVPDPTPRAPREAARGGAGAPTRSYAIVATQRTASDTDSESTSSASDSDSDSDSDERAAIADIEALLQAGNKRRHHALTMRASKEMVVPAAPVKRPRSLSDAPRPEMPPPRALHKEFKHKHGKHRHD